MPSLGRVLLVDDHVLFRKGIAGLLTTRGVAEVVGEASDGMEGIQAARRLKPDLIMMDIHMPNCDGLGATKVIMRELPGTKIVMLTVSDDDDSLFEAIKNGAEGYLLKNMDPDQLFELLDGITRGEAPITRTLATKILHQFADQARQQAPSSASSMDLTARERQILQLLTTGSTNRQIANTLCITENTVKNHLRSILEKLHVQNRVQAAALALREGIVPQDDSPKDAH
jgi:DNA-binding NarL/FixJ family response regulator